MKHLIPVTSILILAPLAACSSGGGGAKLAANAAPSVSFTAPASSTTIEVGESVEIRWIADDPDDEAQTTVVAVGLDVSASTVLEASLPRTMFRAIYGTDGSF